MKALSKYLMVVATVMTAALPIAASASSAATTLPTCTASMLRLGVGPSSTPVAGERSVILTVTNTASAKCQVHGYPSVALFDSTGAVLALRYASAQGSTSPYVTTSSPKTVTLAAGSRAYVKVAKYRCDQDARVARSITITLPGVTGSLSKLKLATAVLRTFALCKGSAVGPGQLVGVSPFSSTAGATFANAPSTLGALVVCTSYNSWPTKAVSSDVVKVVTAYYAQKKLTPITIQNNREWVVPIATQRIGVHWCLNSDGSAAGYTGSVPFAATAAVMVYVHHKPYPVTEAPSHFVVLAKVAGAWKVVSEGTGP